MQQALNEINLDPALYIELGVNPPLDVIKKWHLQVQERRDKLLKQKIAVDEIQEIEEEQVEEDKEEA